MSSVRSAPGSQLWPRVTGLRAAYAFAGVVEVDEVPEALLGLANASYWLGDLAGVIESFERAYAAARIRSDPVLAAAAAMSLVGYHRQFVGNMAAARGWLARAVCIVEADAPQLRGELLGANIVHHRRPRGVRAARGEALEIGRVDGNADLELLAMTAVGGALVQQGRTLEGMALLDEAMAAAVGGECGDPLTVAHTSCMTMLVCASYFDIERATQWVQAMDRFVDRYGCPFLDAECRTNYGRVLFENGDWAAAEKFLVEAVAMSKDVVPSSHVLACGTLAELKLAQGRIEDAVRLLHGLEGRDEAVAAVALLHLAVERSGAGSHIASAAARRRRQQPARRCRADRAPRSG